MEPRLEEYNQMAQQCNHAHSLDSFYVIEMEMEREVKVLVKWRLL